MFPRLTGLLMALACAILLIGQARAAARPTLETSPSVSQSRTLLQSVVPLIVGGDPVKNNRYKYAAALMDRSWSTCTSVLIHEQVLLTAAHCLLNPDIVGAKVAAKNWAVDDILGRVYYPRKMKTSVVHPDSKKNAFRETEDEIGDIALVVLNKPVPGSVTPIKLPKADTKIPAKLTAVGYGITREGDELENPEPNAKLRVVTLDFIPRNECQKLFDKINPGMIKLSNDNICAGTLSGKKDTCTGDSGGPLFIKGATRKDDVLVGLTSFGIGCGRKNTPAGYTNVRKFLPWIRAEMTKFKNAGLIKGPLP